MKMIPRYVTGATATYVTLGILHEWQQYTNKRYLHYIACVRIRACTVKYFSANRLHTVDKTQ
jgi:hypothetical protein